ncbi:MAG: porin family protein [Nitrospirae bacterium]|nr:porin family protein [Nitrospirota bacterium]
MRKFIFVLIAASLFLAAGYASAEGLYVGGNLGATLGNDSPFTFHVAGYADSASADTEYDTGLLVGGRLGYDLGGNKRIEGEVSYYKSGLARNIEFAGSHILTGDLNIFTFFFNGFYDIKAGPRVKPFLGAGIGIMNIEIQDGVSLHDNAFAFQMGGGLGVALNEKLTLDFGYKYLASTDLTFKGDGYSIDSKYSSNNLYLGLRYAVK